MAFKLQYRPVTSSHMRGIFVWYHAFLQRELKPWPCVNKDHGHAWVAFTVRSSVSKAGIDPRVGYSCDDHACVKQPRVAVTTTHSLNSWIHAWLSLYPLWHWRGSATRYVPVYTWFCVLNKMFCCTHVYYCCHFKILTSFYAGHKVI